MDTVAADSAVVDLEAADLVNYSKTLLHNEYFVSVPEEYGVILTGLTCVIPIGPDTGKYRQNTR